MAIKVSYTPYGAVGELAQAAGEAQQEVREQQYAFTASQQAKQINASLQAQRERVGAEMEMQDQRLEQQKVQFDQNLELQTAQVSAQESATHYNYLNNQRQLQQQSEQFEQQMGLKEKAFGLEAAMRQEQFDMAKQKGQVELDAFLDRQTLIDQNVQDWMSLEDQIPDEEYTRGLMATRLGQVYRPTQAGNLTPWQAFSIQDRATKANEKLEQNYMKEQAKSLPQSDASRATRRARELLEDKPFFSKKHAGLKLSDASWVIPNYNTYMKSQNYMAKSDAQKEHLDNIFDAAVLEEGFEIKDLRPYLDNIRQGTRGYKPPRPKLSTTPAQQPSSVPEAQGFVTLPDGTVVTLDQVTSVPPSMSQPSAQFADIMDQVVDLGDIDFSQFRSK